MKEKEIVKQSERSSFLEMLVKKVTTALNFDIEEEFARKTERMVVLRIAAKHIYIWMRQLEMKRKGDERAGWVVEVRRSQE